MAVSLGKPIQWDKERDQKVVEYVGTLHVPITNVQTNKRLKDIIIEGLSLDPDKIDGLTESQINKYLIALPQGLMHLQDAVNRCQNKLEVAQAEFDDIISTPAALLDKDDFGKGVSNITERMRLAKMRENFPDEYDKLTAAIRERKANLNRLEGQLKHLQTMNDNLKKVRESFVKSNNSQGA